MMSDDKVVNMSDYQVEDCWTIQCRDSVHVVQDSVMQAVADGRMDIAEVDRYKDLVMSVFEDWLLFQEQMNEQ